VDVKSLALLNVPAIQIEDVEVTEETAINYCANNTHMTMQSIFVLVLVFAQGLNVNNIVAKARVLLCNTYCDIYASKIYTVHTDQFSQNKLT
jgi:hypothetical protein